MISTAFIPIGLGLFGLFAAFLVFVSIKKSPAGEGKLKEISDAIHLGAMVFMNSEYKRLAIFCVVCITAIAVSDLGMNTALAFLLGAICSGSAGYWGMYTATHANVRTAVAANTKGAAEALNIAFFGGSIMGLTVAAMAYSVLVSFIISFAGDPHTIHAIEGFAMGASSVAPFLSCRWRYLHQEC